jgi:hypothetical protein
VITRDPARRHDGGHLGLHLLPCLAGPSPDETAGDDGQLAVGLRQRLVEAPRLLFVQAVRVTDDEPTLVAEDNLGRLERDESGEGLLVDGPVAILWGGEEIGVIRGGERADEGER